jgi:Helix-turn-helix domain
MSMSTVAQVRSASKSKGSARTLLLVIASHENPDTGWAWPSLDTLADEIARTRRHVIRLIAQLEALGELEVRRGHGRGHVNFYRVHLTTAEAGPSTPAKKVTSAPAEKVTSSPRKGDMLCREKVTSMSPKSKRERKEKEAPSALFSLFSRDGADAPDRSVISPDVMRKFGLRYGVDEWPPPRREKE